MTTLKIAVVAPIPSANVPIVIAVKPGARNSPRSIQREHEEFEVETDKPGELPFSFWSETVRQVVVE